MKRTILAFLCAASIAGTVAAAPAGDYDFIYYWMDSSGQISDTWETSITELSEGETAGTYLLHNLFKDTFSDDLAGSGVADIVVKHDAVAGTLSIAAGQHLFDLNSGNEVYDIRILGVRLGDKGYEIGVDGTLTLTEAGKGYELAPESDLIGFYIGTKNASGRLMGYGCAIYPAMYRFNGVQIYQVTTETDPDSEGVAMLNDIYTEVVDGKIHISNFANFGYNVTVEFDYDLSAGTATARNAKLGTLRASDGSDVPYYACDAADAVSIYGSALKDGDDYVLTAKISKDMLGNNILTTPLWGAYLEDNPIALYSGPAGFQSMLFLDIAQAAGIHESAAKTDSDDKPGEWYDINGRRVYGTPSRGIYVSKGKKYFVL